MYGTLDPDPENVPLVSVPSESQPSVNPSRGGANLRRRPSLQTKQRPSYAHRNRKQLPGVMHNNRPVLTEVLGSTKPKHHDEDEDGFAFSRTKKSFVYTMLNPRSNEWQAAFYKWFITIVIVADLLSFVISTEPDITEKQMEFFHVWEGVTSSIFLIEYMTRLVVVTESKKYGSMGMLWGRLRYMVTLNAIVDALSTLPFFLELFTGLDLPTLTYLRSFRLLRILKTNGFSEATRAVGRVVYYNSQILYVALLIGIGLILITSVLMYYLRPRDPEDAHGKQLLSCSHLIAGQSLITHQLFTCIGILYQSLQVPWVYNVFINDDADRSRRARGRLAMVHQRCGAIDWSFFHWNVRHSCFHVDVGL